MVKGDPALLGIEHMGCGVAAFLREVLETERFAPAEHLDSGAEPGAVLTQVPGIAA